MIELATHDVIERLGLATGAQMPWDVIGNDSTWSLVFEDIPIAVFGVQQMWPGFGQLWGIVDKAKASGHGVWMTHQARQLMRQIVEEKDFRQVRTLCLCLEDIRWAELTGFETEGVWKDAGPQGESVFVMAYHRRV